MSKAFDEVDFLVTTGGVSMGDKDMLKRVLIEDFNATIHFGLVRLIQLLKLLLMLHLSLSIILIVLHKKSCQPEARQANGVRCCDLEKH